MVRLMATIMVARLGSLSIRKICKTTTTTSSSDMVSRYSCLILTGDRNEYAQPARALNKGDRATVEEVDEYGRVVKGPITLKNGATYTGQWLSGLRDGYGTQLWPDGSRYEGQW